MTQRRAIKNLTELAGMEQAYLKDSLAFVRYLAWLEEEVRMKDVTEYQAALQVEEFRMNSELYEGPAYETVSAIASNAGKFEVSIYLFEA